MPQKILAYGLYHLICLRRAADRKLLRRFAKMNLLRAFFWVKNVFNDLMRADRSIIQ